MAFLPQARGIFGRVFGRKSSKVVEQVLLWQVAGQIIGTILQPGLVELSKLLNSQFQAVPLTPAQLADMVVRNVLPLGEATDIAKQSGVSPSDFHHMVQDTGEAPGPGDLVDALRRGVIPEKGAGPDSVSFEQGIREGRLKDKWIPVIRSLATRLPSPSDALDALLEGQAEEPDARTLYERFGGDPTYFTLLFNTRGSAPTPVEALEMANRRIIPWDGHGPDVTSFEQAFLEGPWRNKWLGAFRALGAHLPPPRTVVALLRSGAITDPVALDLFQRSGLSPELAAAYVADAHHQKSQGSRQLTVSTILDLYEQRLITPEQTTTLLGDLGYSAQDAAYEMALKDMQREIRAINAATSRIGQLYIARKIDVTAARNALNTYRVPDAQVQELLTTWDTERSLTFKTLTAAEIVAAFHWTIFDQATAEAELVNLGYTQFDAWALLSIREHVALPGRPAQ